MNHPNSPIELAVRVVLGVALLLAVSAPAAAMERGPFSLEVLVDGRPLTEHIARGARYVEALEGREYSLRLRNHTSQRIAVALAVDGLNTIDAKHTGAREASKWILGPWETITLDGWQTGNSTARRFFFTTEEKSYGAWLGKTTNLGVISAAVFREKKPVAFQRPRREKMRSTPAPAGESGRRDSSVPLESEVRDEAADSAAPGIEPSDEMAATGIGREVDHRVHRVRFEAERNPAAVLEVRYEYRDALVRLGVLPPSYAWQEDPLERRERASGFSDTGFAPDPYRHRRR
jgi:hypothetical protein